MITVETNAKEQKSFLVEIPTRLGRKHWPLCNKRFEEKDAQITSVRVSIDGKQRYPGPESTDEKELHSSVSSDVGGLHSHGPQTGHREVQIFYYRRGFLRRLVDYLRGFLRRLVDYLLPAAHKRDMTRP